MKRAIWVPSRHAFLYHNRYFKKLIGSRAEVFHGNAIRTNGGLLANQLMRNAKGKIVSFSKHVSATRDDRVGRFPKFRAAAAAAGTRRRRPLP